MAPRMIGEVVGSYRIVAKLGEGGMGAVYLGEHLHIARKAAIKVLLPEYSAKREIVARFFNEARATSLVRHPGIVDIVDCSVLPDGNAYIVMEFLEGESLGSRLRDHARLPTRGALFLARHIADALAAAHAQRIVHRDLKPDNVFLLTASEAAPIKILDFGIAKLMQTGSGEGSYKTRTGSLLGTPVYMSPEQCRGAGEVDHRTDIYSLGCILFEMLCGRPPFTHEGFGELIQAHLSQPPPRARSIEASVPPAVDALVARLLAKSPDERPQTMRDLVAELDVAIAASPTAPAPEGSAPPSRSVAPRPVAQTMPMPPASAKHRTTFESAASEKMNVITDSVVDGPLPSRRGRGPLVAVAGGLVAAAAAVAIWISQRPGAELPPRERPVVTVAPESQPPAKPQIVPAADEQPPPPPVAVEAKRQPAAAPAPRKVKVAIASEPSGADVCLARDHALIGKTNFEWSTDKSPRSAKLLIRKRGYRGQELSVAVDRDSKKEVALTKLGPDDLDDTDNCERR